MLAALQNGLHSLALRHLIKTLVLGIPPVLQTCNICSVLSSFNKAIGNWNTSSVTNMEAMFSFGLPFNQDIGPWNTSNATNIDMFKSASAFNQDLSVWCVSVLVVSQMNLKFCYSHGEMMLPSSQSGSM